MERPPTDPRKLLAHWMEWEAGEVNPGRLVANLKTDGLPDLLRTLVDALDAESA